MTLSSLHPPLAPPKRGGGTIYGAGVTVAVTVAAGVGVTVAVTVGVALGVGVFVGVAGQNVLSRISVNVTGVAVIVPSEVTTE